MQNPQFLERNKNLQTNKTRQAMGRNENFVGRPNVTKHVCQRQRMRKSRPLLMPGLRFTRNRNAVETSNLLDT